MTQDNNSVDSINNTQHAINHYEVVFSTRYTFTATSSKTDTVFAFDALQGGNYDVNNDNQYGLSGVVVRSVQVPEPSSYALLAGCIALTCVMLRRPRC